MPRYDFECPDGHRFEHDCPMADRHKAILCKRVSCVLQASMVMGHSNPAGMLDHGSASNRDAAREGRYDPFNPNRRFIAKGRQWRK